jgi:hypothetical protein
MTDGTPTTTDAWKIKASERASTLNSNGAHYFLGWLISAGTYNPEIMSELMRVLHAFESDHDLRHWFKEAPDAGTVAIRATEESAPPPKNEHQSAPVAINSRIVSASQTLDGPADSDARQERQTSGLRQFTAKILDRFSKKTRVAA